MAYDRDGAVGDLYGVAICPLVELAARGGIVKDRLWRSLADPGGARRAPAGTRGAMSGGEPELRAARGFLDAAVRDEFPGLRLDWVTLEVRPRRSPRELTRRLGEAANRYRGANVVALRSQPLPMPIALLRQIGLVPDVDRIPSERAALERLMHGGFRSRGIVPDALLIALIETGVPVWALDARPVDAGGLGIRIAAPGDRRSGRRR